MSRFAVRKVKFQRFEARPNRSKTMPRNKQLLGLLNYYRQAIRVVQERQYIILFNRI